MRVIRWRRQYADPENDARLGKITEIDAQVMDDKTVQSYKDDADINVLVRRFGVTGELPRSSTEPFYGDFSEVGSYQDALNAVIEADAAFERLPAAIRNRFRNDPAELIEFLQSEGNREEAERLGLIPKPEPIVPVKVVQGDPEPLE